jgi:hypothetical protein
LPNVSHFCLHSESGRRIILLMLGEIREREQG